MKIFAIISGVVALLLGFILFGVDHKTVQLLEQWKNREQLEWQQRVEEHDGDPIAAITIDDGIDKFEAYAAAGNYFFSYISGCGFPTEL